MLWKDDLFEIDLITFNSRQITLNLLLSQLLQFCGLRQDAYKLYNSTTVITTHLVMDCVQLLSNMYYNYNGTMGLCHLPTRMKIQVEHGGKP